MPFSYTGEVMSVSPEAERAGIRVGDRIEKINDVLINNNTNYRGAVSDLQSDRSVRQNG